MDSQIDINQVVDTLLAEIGEQAKQIAMLKIQLVAAQKAAEPDNSETIKEADD